MLGWFEHSVKRPHALHRLWHRREQCHRHIMHRIAKRVVDYCKRFKIHKIMAGYTTGVTPCVLLNACTCIEEFNTNWKTRVNMGTEGEQAVLPDPVSSHRPAPLRQGRGRSATRWLSKTLRLS